jgi:hypothetical protein
MIIDTPLVLSTGVRVNNQLVFNFRNAMHTQGVFTNSHKERRHENFKMGVKQIHKQKFKMKLIYTNQQKKMLMQIKPKWCMKKP